MAQEAAVPRGLREMIQKMIDDSISRFARSGFLRNASISGGAGLTIKDGGAFRTQYPTELGGGAIFYSGDLYSEADGSFQGTGTLWQQPDGTDIGVARTDAANGSMWQIRDGDGVVVLATEAQGLGRPVIPIVFYPVNLGAVPWGTTSSSFLNLWRAATYLQQPQLVVAVGAAMDTAGTTGQLRVMVNGQQFGATQTVTSTSSSWAFGPAPIVGSYGSPLTVEIQALRTSASGTLYALPVSGSGFPLS